MLKHDIKILGGKRAHENEGESLRGELDVALEEVSRLKAQDVPLARALHLTLRVCQHLLRKEKS